jgi:hypothetical protein
MGAWARGEYEMMAMKAHALWRETRARAKKARKEQE